MPDGGHKGAGRGVQGCRTEGAGLPDGVARGCRTEAAGLGGWPDGESRGVARRGQPYIKKRVPYFGHSPPAPSPTCKKCGCAGCTSESYRNSERNFLRLPDLD